MIDTQANGAFPNLTDVFEKSHWWRSIRYLQFPQETGRYKILMDKVLRINELSLLDGILRQIDGMQPLDYNTSKACKS